MNITFGELVHTKRELLGLSMRELARRTLVDVAYLSKIEKGQSLNPNFSVVMRIARELSINMETLQDVFQLNNGMEEVINGEINKGVLATERNAIKDILEGIIKVTDTPEFNIESMGLLLQKVYSVHQQKHKSENRFYVISIENTKWMHVLELPVIDNKLLNLYYQAFNISEENSFVIKGEVLKYPEYFNESQILTLNNLLEKCNLINEDDEMYINFIELKEYLCSNSYFE